MIYYIILYFILFLSSFFGFFNKKEVSYFLYISSFLFSLYILLFRDMVGGYDIYVYSWYYENIQYNGNYYDYEIGYYYLNLFLNYLNSDRYFLIGFVGFVFCTTLYYFCYKIEKKYFSILFFLILLKLYFISFTYFRQILAVCCFLIAFLMLYKNYKVKYILFSLIALSLHISSIISFVIYFLSKRILSKGEIILVASISVFLALFMYFNLGFQSFIALYMQQGESSSYLITRSFNLLYIIEAFILLFFVFHSYDNYNIKNNNRFIIFNITVLYICIDIISSVNGTSIRFLWFIAFAPIVFLIDHINFFMKQSIEKSFLFILILIFYFSIACFKYLYSFDGGLLLEYSTIFDIIKDGNQHSDLEYR